MPRLSAAMQAVCAAMTASSVASTMLLSSGAGMFSQPAILNFLYQRW